MRVIDLIDRLATNELRDRSDIVAGPDDTIWSDELLLTYYNRCMDIIARDVGCFLTSKSFTLVAGASKLKVPTAIRISQIRENNVVVFNDRANYTFNMATEEVQFRSTPRDRVLEIHYSYAPRLELNQTTEEFPLSDRHVKTVEDYIMFCALNNRDADGLHTQLAQARYASFIEGLVTLKNEMFNARDRQPRWSWPM